MHSQGKVIGELQKNKISRSAKLRELPLQELSQEELDSLIYDYAAQVPYRTYYLSTSENELQFNTQTPLIYYCLGCGGNGSVAQYKVFETLNNYIAEDPTNRTPAFICITGDNIYDSGAHSPSDIGFKKCFEDVIKSFPYLKNAKFIITGGNHDSNIQKIVVGESGESVLLNQVAYTYKQKFDEFAKEISKPTFDSVIKKVDEFFNKKVKHPDPKIKEKINILPIDKLPAWNMFSPAFSVVAGNVEFFYLNSNNLAERLYDFIELKKTQFNQIEFLIRAYKQSKKEKRKATGIIMHHTVNTPGSRAYGNDFSWYCLDEKKRAEILRFFGLDEEHNFSNNEITDYTLRYLKEKYGFSVNFINGAHDHNNYCSLSHLIDLLEEKNYYDALFCFGGGGGPLQSRKYFGNQKQMGGFFEAFGFGEFKGNQQTGEITATFHMLEVGKKQIYVFEHKSIIPKRKYPEHVLPEEQSRIEKFCEVVKHGLDKYFYFLHQKQEEYHGKFLSKRSNLKHGDDGVLRANKLWNYISRYHADDYATTLKTIYQISKWNPNPLVSLAKNMLNFFFDDKQKNTEAHTNSLITCLDKVFGSKGEEELKKKVARTQSGQNLKLLYSNLRSLEEKKERELEDENSFHFVEKDELENDESLRPSHS